MTSRFSLWQNFEEERHRVKLVGDNGYAQMDFLMTPVARPTRQGEEDYNRALRATRYKV